MTDRPQAVLLLSHGSRDPRHEHVVNDLVSAVTAGTGVVVHAAHLDYTGPTPAFALRQLAVEGFTSVRVLPLLFTPGYHATHDVPAAVADSALRGPLKVSGRFALCGAGEAGRPQEGRLLLMTSNATNTGPTNA